MSKVLLDTNILIYTKDISSIFHKNSIALFESEFELHTTSKNLVEYFAVVTRGENYLLTPEDALKDITEFSESIKVLYPDQLSNDILLELINKYKPKGIKVHDFEIAAVAISNGINTLFTFDKDGFKNIQELKIVVP